MNAINLIDIKDVNQYTCYFLDANVWLLQLKKQIYKTEAYFKDQTDRKYEATTDFIEKILELNILEKPAPKIAMTSLLLSEVTNRYMRDIAMRMYFGKNYDPRGFKEHYRPTEDYNKKLQDFLETLLSYESSLQLLDDAFSDIGLPALLESFKDTNYDFNDLFFYHLAKKYSLPIVTNDGDFTPIDVTIITQNTSILEKMARFKPQKRK